MSGVVLCNKNKNCINDRGRYHFGINWTADENGDVPLYATPSVDGYITLVNVVPGDPAPSNGYNITLTDNCGVELMGGVLSDLPNDENKQFSPNIAGKKGDRMVQGQITFNLTGNTVSGAKGKCIIFIQE